MSWISNFLFGSPEKHERVSTLMKSQQPLYNQLQASLMGQGAGGAFGGAADYYRSILSQDPNVMQQFFAPEMRKFQQEIVPGLSEQFAGMGSGGLSSSGFRNAALQAGTDLQERLAAIRANLMQGAAQGMTGLGQLGLGNYSQDVMTQAGSPGLLSTLGPGIGAGLGMALGGPLGSALGSGITSMFGKSSPYGAQQAQNTMQQWNKSIGQALR